MGDLAVNEVVDRENGWFVASMCGSLVNENVYWINGLFVS